jgi:ABC-type transport system involved in multi-copper enzyme maturation permease subunit
MKTLSTIGSVVLFIIALISIVFGFLMVLGSFSADGSRTWAAPGGLIILFGLVCVAAAIVLIVVGRRNAKQEAAAQNVSINVDLPGQMKIDAMKCQNCGGVLTSDNVSMAAGGLMVSCPYCGTTYQMTEEPKW